MTKQQKKGFFRKIPKSTFPIYIFKYIKLLSYVSLNLGIILYTYMCKVSECFGTTLQIYKCCIYYALYNNAFKFFQTVKKRKLKHDGGFIKLVSKFVYKLILLNKIHSELENLFLPIILWYQVLLSNYVFGNVKKGQRWLIHTMSI